MLKLVTVFQKHSLGEPSKYRFLDLEDENKIINLNKEDLYNRLQNGEVFLNVSLIDGRITVDDSVYHIGFSRNKEMSIYNTLDVMNAMNYWAKDLHLLDPDEVPYRNKENIPFRCPNGHIFKDSAYILSYKSHITCPECEAKERAERLKAKEEERTALAERRAAREAEKEAARLAKEATRAEKEATRATRIDKKNTKNIIELYKERKAKFCLDELRRGDNDYNIDDILDNPNEYKDIEFDFKCELGHSTKYTLSSRVKYANNIIKRCKSCIAARNEMIDLAIMYIVSRMLDIDENTIELDKIIKNQEGSISKIKMLIEYKKLAIFIADKAGKPGLEQVRYEVASYNGYKSLTIKKPERLAGLFLSEDISALGAIRIRVEELYNDIKDRLLRLGFDTKDINIDDCMNYIINNIKNDIDIVKLANHNKKSTSKKDSNKDKDAELEESKIEESVNEDDANKTKVELHSKKELSESSDNSITDENIEKVGLLNENTNGYKLKPLKEINNSDKFVSIIIKGCGELKADSFGMILLKLVHYVYMTDFIKFANIVEDSSLKYEYYNREFKIVSTKHYEVRNVSSIQNTCVLVDTSLGVAKNIKYIKRVLSIADLSDKVFLKLEKTNG